MKPVKQISKLLYRVVIIPFILFFTFNALLYIKQPGMVFYPVKSVAVTPKEWGLPYDAVEIKLADKRKISGWYFTAF